MAIVKLDKGIWQQYFDKITKILMGKQVEIEVASLKLGDQCEQEWIQFLGISYDPKDDLVEVLVEGLDHLIQKPQEIWVDGVGLALSSVEVLDNDGNKHLIRLRDPLMLPEPNGR